jgi:aminobenzoyl-glutamate transport protein
MQQVIGALMHGETVGSVGAAVAIMLPYAAWLTVLWTALLVLWYLLGLPFGLA